MRRPNTIAMSVSTWAIRRMHTRPVRLFLALMLTFSSLPLGVLLPTLPLLTPRVAEASTFTVTTTVDTRVHGCSATICTLRAAIYHANFAPGSTVVVPAGTYVLTAESGDNAVLNIWADMTIQGAGAASTIVDANQLDRVLYVSGTTANVTVSGVTIQNGAKSGNWGGGIYNNANLTISNSIIKNNSTRVSVDSFDGKGAGIFNQTGNLVVTHSTISDNTAGEGGGLLINGGTAKVIGSTISNNSPDGIVTYGQANLTITNSTIADNTAPASASIAHSNSALFARGPTTITNSTLVGVAGTENLTTLTAGLNSTVTVTNSIITSDTGVSCATVSNTILPTPVPPATLPASGTLTSGGNNISYDATCGFTASGDLQSTNPLLNALASNGGPTQTMALQSTSPAINAGSNTVCALTGVGNVNNVDQRGVTRPEGTDCDIGAYEHGVSATLLTVSAPTPATPTAGQPFSVTVTSMSATNVALNVTTNTTITLARASGINPSGQLNGTLTQTMGSGASSVTFTGLTYSGADPAVTLSAAATDGTVLTGGTGAPFAVVLVFTPTTTADSTNGSCTLTLCSLRDAIAAANAAPFSVVTIPGASTPYLLTNGELAVSANMTIRGDSAATTVIDGNGSGRVFNVQSSTVAIRDVTVQNGMATTDGGAGIRNNGTLMVTASTFSNNAAAGAGDQGWNEGGAIFNTAGATLVVTRSTFSGNSALTPGGFPQGSGGAISNHGTLTLTNSTLSNNQADDISAIVNYGASATVTNSTIVGYSNYVFGALVAANNTASVSFANAIVAYSGPNAATATACLEGFGTSNTAGHNLSSDASCGFTGTGDLQNTNPLLGPLASNGGPTQTLALLAGSPAIDAGNDAVCGAAPVDEEDQRGVVRPQGTHCDIGAFEWEPESALSISDVQGAAHSSPLDGQQVPPAPPPTRLLTDAPDAAIVRPQSLTPLMGVAGVVTALSANGFYMQDPTPHDIPAKSSGIFVATGSAPTVSVGDAVMVSGTVMEVRQGGPTSPNLTTTQIVSPTVTVVSQGHRLPEPVIIGSGGRVPPGAVIKGSTGGTGDVESGGAFNPAVNGIDFHESLEGMLVQVHGAVAVGPRSSDGVIPVVSEGSATAGPDTARGGLYVHAGDFNPERILVDDELLQLASQTTPIVHTGAAFTSPIVGVLGYRDGNFRLHATRVPTVEHSLLHREVKTNPIPTELSVATLDVAHFSPAAGAGTATELATIIVDHLKSPDLIAVEGLLDGNGTTNDGQVGATASAAMLITAIQTATGPTYSYRDIAPVNNQDGGPLGGNRRSGFLYRTDRGLAFVERAGGTATTAVGVSNVGGTPQLSVSPGRIAPIDAAFTGNDKPLAGEFTFYGQKLFAIASHFTGHDGDTPLFGRFQPPMRPNDAPRQQQAQLVNDFVDSILAINANADIVVLGNFNDHRFSTTLTTLRGGVLHNLVDRLPNDQRYDAVQDGNSQMLHGALVSGGTNSRPIAYDIVHVNAEFAVRVSDVDPHVARIRFSVASDSTPPVVTPVVTGTLGNNGWYTSNVQVSWSVSDPDSPVSGRIGCREVTVTIDTAGRSFSCAATSAGGTTTESVTIKRDATPPLVSASTLGANRSSGVYTAPFTLVWSGRDATSGNASCSSSETYSGPDTGSGTLTGSCTDQAGNSGNRTFNFQYDAPDVTGLTLSFNVSPATFAQVITVNATLVNQAASNAPVAGVPVSVTIDGTRQVGITNASGVATIVYAVNLAASTYPVTAEFGGNGQYAPSSDSATLTVVSKAATVAYTGARVLDTTAANLPVSARVVEPYNGRYGNQLGTVQVRFALFTTLADALAPSATPVSSLQGTVSGSPAGTVGGTLSLPAAGNYFLQVRQTDAAGYYTLVEPYPVAVSVLTPEGSRTVGGGTVSAPPMILPLSLTLDDTTVITPQAGGPSAIVLSGGLTGGGGGPYGGVRNDLTITAVGGATYQLRFVGATLDSFEIGCAGGGGCAQKQTSLSGRGTLSIYNAAGDTLLGKMTGLSYRADGLAGSGGTAGYHLTLADAAGRRVLQVGTLGNFATVSPGAITVFP